MSFANRAAGAKPAGGGNNITDGRGVLVVKDVFLIKGNDDPETFIAELYVKESTPMRADVTPNPAGSTVSFVKKCTSAKQKGNLERAMAFLDAVVGPDFAALPEDKRAATIGEILRLDQTGYTKQGTQCPLKGFEVSFETYRKFTKDGKTEMTLPKFNHREVNKEQIQANRALVDGKA